MYKVLIVDDEKIIRQGIKILINWSELGFEIVGEASNGIEALEMIDSINPDLIIVDIKMPKMDGLTFLSKLKERRNESKIIVLSAYSDFKYAQKAIELGVSYYLIKPIDEEDLILKLKKIYIEIKKSNNLKIFEYSKDKVIENILINSNGDYLKLNNLYNFNLPWSKYRIAIIQLENIFTNEIKKFIEEYISKEYIAIVFSVNDNICLLINCDKLNNFMRLYHQLIETLNKTFLINTTIFVGKIISKFEDIKISFRYLLELMDNRFIYNNKILILENENSNNNLENINMNIISEELIGLIEISNNIALYEKIEKLNEYFINFNHTEKYIKLYCISVISNIVSKTSKIKESDFDLKDISELIYAKSSLSELSDYLIILLKEISKKINTSNSDTQIEKILEYIDKNYYKDLKLDYLAKVFNYNGTYLGRLFKNSTGKYYNNYLESVRLEKAIEFLLNGDKTSNIAEKIGYKDIDYFYKKFKKYTGVSPTEYKKKYIENS